MRVGTALINTSAARHYCQGRTCYVMQVRIERKQITWPGARIKKKGEGMPSNEDYNIRGNLIISFDVDFPRGELSMQDKQGTTTVFARFHKHFYFSHRNNSVIVEPEQSQHCLVTPRFSFFWYFTRRFLDLVLYQT